MRVKEYKHIQPEEATCNRCGAVLEYCPADVKATLTATNVIRTITCPVCGKAIYLQSVREMFASHPAEKLAQNINKRKRRSSMSEDERKMMAYLAMILSKVATGQQLNDNETQSLDNIASELGAYTLSEDEFRY